MYGSLTTDVTPERRTSALLNMGFGRLYTSGPYGNSEPMLEQHSLDVDLPGDLRENNNGEPNIGRLNSLVFSSFCFIFSQFFCKSKSFKVVLLHSA